jgi:hypothetical protein
MTAISAFKSSNSVDVFSDGLWIDPASGKPGGIGTKVTVLPEYNAVFAVTGLSTVQFLLSSLLIETPLADIRSLANAMPELVRKCVTQGKAVGHILNGRCDVVLAGWSENAGPLIFQTECFFEHNLFKGRAVERYIRPFVDASQMRFPDDGLRLLEKQRGLQFSRPIAGTFGSVTVDGLVGGFAQETRIDAEGIKIRVLKRWDDKLSEPPAD